MNVQRHPSTTISTAAGSAFNTSQEMKQPRALRREGLPARVAPFITPAIFGFIPLFMPADTNAQIDVSVILVAAILSVVTLLSVFLIPWDLLPRQAEILPPIAYILIIFLMREGASYADYVFAPLLLLPLFWLSLHGTRQDLLAGFLLTTIINIFSLWYSGGSTTAIQFQFLAIIISPVICFTTQSLVQRIRQQASQLSAQALTDGLTGIYNRRAWDEELPRAMSRASRYRHPMCIALCDIDKFKLYNDEHGHQVGDQLLRDLAHNWQIQMRDCDFLSRYGGEEFAIVFHNCVVEGALVVLQRLCAVVPDGQTCSVGVACWDGQEVATILFDRVDAALYTAKENGRNRIEIAPFNFIKDVEAAPSNGKGPNADLPLLPVRR
jgi:diguanylate cyclase (GGDEF)-like protein